MSATCLLFEVNSNFSKTTKMERGKADKKYRDSTEYFIKKGTNKRTDQEEISAYSQLSAVPLI